MIKLQNMKYNYGEFRLSADMTIDRGGFVAILGPSGAGKSTLLNLIAGFEKPTSGAIVLQGQDMTNIAPSMRPVNMMFQDNNTFAHLSVMANVALGLSPSLNLTAAQTKLVDTALWRVGLQQLANKKPGEISGGERQRIALARILVRNRPILLLDEPLSALDPALRTDMLSLILHIHAKEKLTTLFVTHNPQDAKQFADSVIFLTGGVARKPVPTANFFLNQFDPDITSYLGTKS